MKHEELIERPNDGLPILRTGPSETWRGFAVMGYYSEKPIPPMPGMPTSLPHVDFHWSTPGKHVAYDPLIRVRDAEAALASLHAQAEAMAGALAAFNSVTILEPNGVILGAERYHFEKARQSLAAWAAYKESAK